MTKPETYMHKKAASLKQEGEAELSQKQLVHQYNALLANYRKLKKENSELREEIEEFSKKLTKREKDVSLFRHREESMLSLLEHIRHEELRIPALQARNSFQEQRSQQCEELREHFELDEQLPTREQDILPLNIWLTTRDSFVDKIVGHYIRKRDRVLVIHEYDLLKQILSTGMLPDIIITGAYDFSLDDPNHTAFSGFLDRVFKSIQTPQEPREFFIITVSSSVPAQPSMIQKHHHHLARHEFISKFRGLQVTISEVRFFLEMRRCQKDIMAADFSYRIKSMGDVAQVMLDIQQQEKTGLLAVLSEDTPTNVRWSFQLLFLQGKLVKTEHTLESSVMFPDEVEEEPMEKIFTVSSFDEKYQLNKPTELYFFTLRQHAILRELLDQDSLSQPSLF